MKLAIPVKMNKLNSPVAPLFGKAKWFAIVKGGELFSIIPNNQSSGVGVVELFHEMKIDALLTQELGATPYEKIKEQGTISIYHTGFKRILLNDLLKKFEDGELELLDDTNINKIIKHHKKKHLHTHAH